MRAALVLLGILTLLMIAGAVPVKDGTQTAIFRTPVLMTNTFVQLDVSDTDGDGIPAYWELRYFAGATNANPDADGDGDGISEYGEYLAITLPDDSNSFPRVEGIQTVAASPSGTVVSVSFTSEYARVYSLESASNLTGTVDWTNVTAFAPGSGGLMSQAHTNTRDGAFYRLEIDLP